MKTRNKYNNNYDDLASLFSGDNANANKLPEGYPDEKGRKIFNYLNEMKNSRGDEKAVVDNAWNSLMRRFEEDNLLTAIERQPSFNLSMVARIAAVIIVVTALAITGRYVISEKMVAPDMVIKTTALEKNMTVRLSDGSVVSLNRNSELVYPGKFRKGERRVKLVGEAFFEITPDTDKPFIIDAGDAEITVLGTSFNVMTDNGSNQVEVMVTTGKVMVTSSDGTHELTLEPGSVGTLNSNNAAKSVNKDPNYLSWKSDILVFEGEPLDKAFRDLKRVYNLNIIANQEEILQKRISTVFENQSPDTIVAIICKSYNFTYEKIGDTYYISRK